MDTLHESNNGVSRKAPKKEPTMSVIDQLRELDKQREAIMKKAKTEAMSKVESAIAELNELGFSYALVEQGQKRTGGGGRTGTRTIKDEPCPICNFKTEPPHDRRAHRSQPEGNKTAFSTEELNERGYTRVQ